MSKASTKAPVKAFASQADLTEKKITFEQLSPHCWAYTAEGDPNSGVIIGDRFIMVSDARKNDSFKRLEQRASDGTVVDSSSDGDAGGDESEEPDNHFHDATEAGGQESRSGRHDPAACDRRTAEEFKHLIECSEGLATNCAHCNRRLDKATWKERLVSREDYPFGAYCTAACSQLHFVMRHPPARSRYDEGTPPCAVSFKPNNMCPCLRDDGESALAAHGTVRTKILSSRGNLSFDHCDLDVFYCCMCEKLFVPDEQDLACQGAIVLCSRSRRDDNDRFAIPGFPVASAIARWNIGWVEDTSTVLVELALLFQLMFSRFGPAHAGIKGFVASEQLAVEDLHGATSTGVISGDMRKHLHHTLLQVTTGYMLASKQADGTLEMKWRKCPHVPELVRRVHRWHGSLLHY
jgi:hypothetical protein